MLMDIEETLIGSTFNELYGNSYILPVYNNGKNGRDHHFAMEITKGINTVSDNSGLYFYKIINKNNIDDFLHFEKYIGYYEIEISNDTILIFNNDDSLITTQVEVVSDFKEFSSLECFSQFDFCHNIVKNNKTSSYKYFNLSSDNIDKLIQLYPHLIKYFNTNNEDILINCVNKNGLYLEFINNQSLNICSAALKNNIKAIAYVQDICESLILPYIHEYPRLIEYIDNPPEELCCQIIIKCNYPKIIKFIKNQHFKACLTAVTLDGLCLKYIKNQTVELVNQALISNPNSIKYVLESLMNENMCRFLTSIDYRFIKYFDIQPPDICINMVKQNGLLLEHIKHKNQNNEICKLAIINNIDSIKWAKYISPEIANHVLYTTPKYASNILNNIDIKIINSDVLMKLLNNDPSLISNINNPPLEIIIYVLQKNGLLLKYINDDIQNEQIVMTAIKNNINSIKYAKFQNESIVNHIFNSRKYDLLEYIDKNKLTREICNKAVITAPEVIKYIPKHIQDETMCFTAVFYNIEYYKYVQIDSEKIDNYVLKKDPTKFIMIRNKTVDMCRYILEKYPSYSKYIPSNIINDHDKLEFALKLHENNPGVLTHIIHTISEETFTYDICEKIIKKNPRNYMYIPQKYLIGDVAKLIVTTHPHSLHRIENQTLDIILCAIKQNEIYIRHAKKELVKEHLNALFEINPKIINHLNDNIQVPIELQLKYCLYDSSYINNCKNKSIYMYVSMILLNPQCIDKINDGDLITRLQKNSIILNFPDIINKLSQKYNSLTAFRMVNLL